MKKSTILLAIVFTVAGLSAQAPEKMSYQAVVRDAANKLVTNHAVGMRISILQTTATGTVVYKETQTTTTNVNGLASIEIGAGTTTDVFTAIDWSKGPYFLKTEIDPAGGTSYSITSTSELLSVPYALFAKTAGNVTDNSITASKIVDGTIVTSDIADMAVNSAKIQDASITTTDLAGDIITTFKIVNGAVTSDKLGANAVISEKINAGAVTGVKIAQAGATSGQVLKWNGSIWTPANDDLGGLTLPYINSVTQTSGFAINITTNGSSCIKGTGVVGVIGETNSAEGGNFGMGVSGRAPQSTGNYYGVYGTTNSTSGVGVYGLAFQSSGVTKGVYGETRSPSGYGIQGLTTSSSGYSGYFIGGKFYVDGNVGIGVTSPAQKLDVNGVINIRGNAANQSLLCNSDEAIWYDGTYFSWGYGGTANYFRNKIFVGATYATPTQMLDVNGNARFRAIGSGAYSGAVNRMADGTLTTATSDGRLKENVTTLQDCLDKVMNLRGVSFTWKNNPEYGKRIGFIAQEFEDVIPELVFTNETDGYKGINYAETTAVLVEAIKELKAENESLKTRLEKIEQKYLKE